VIVREVHEDATDVPISRERRTASYDVRSIVNVIAVATVVPIETLRPVRFFAMRVRAACNPNTLLCTASHQNRLTRCASSDDGRRWRCIESWSIVEN